MSFGVLRVQTVHKLHRIVFRTMLSEPTPTLFRELTLDCIKAKGFLRLLLCVLIMKLALQ
jgi:hypothetical protein